MKTNFVMRTLLTAHAYLVGMVAHVKMHVTVIWKMWKKEYVTNKAELVFVNLDFHLLKDAEVKI